MPAAIVSTRAEELAAGIVHTPSERPLPAASIQALCNMACSTDPEEALAGTGAIFRRIVEHWGDQFEPRLCERYIEFFSALIGHYRRRPGAQAFDAALRRLGIPGERSLVERAERQRRPSPVNIPRRATVQKAFVLSRVTLGADVAVTSLFLAAAKLLFPAAEISLVGGEKGAAFFAGDDAIHTLRIEYSRGSPLPGRFDVWRKTAALIDQSTAGLKPEEFVILDPDSRITQLGLLPLVSNLTPYFYFESRSYGATTSLPLARLTARWLREMLGPECDGLLPFVRLPKDDLELGKLVRQTVRGPVAAVNFGVGGNEAKRVGGEFEMGLLGALFHRGFSVVLDYGAGPDETVRTRQLVAACEAKGTSVGRIDPGQCPDARLLTWQGSLNAFAGIIASSDLYAGYDSAGGHLAAALGVPGIDIFAGEVCERMRQRWRPWGKTPADVVATGASSRPEEILAAAVKLVP